MLYVGGTLPCGRFYYENVDGFFGNSFLRLSYEYVYLYLGLLAHVSDRLERLYCGGAAWRRRLAVVAEPVREVITAAEETAQTPVSAPVAEEEEQAQTAEEAEDLEEQSEEQPKARFLDRNLQEWLPSPTEWATQLRKNLQEIADLLRRVHREEGGLLKHLVSPRAWLVSLRYI